MPHCCCTSIALWIWWLRLMQSTLLFYSRNSCLILRSYFPLYIRTLSSNLVVCFWMSLLTCPKSCQCCVTWIPHDTVVQVKCWTYWFCCLFISRTHTEWLWPYVVSLLCSPPASSSFLDEATRPHGSSVTFAVLLKIPIRYCIGKSWQELARTSFVAWHRIVVSLLEWNDMYLCKLMLHIVLVACLAS